MSDEGHPDVGAEPGSPDMGDLYDELAELEETVDTQAEREQVRETMRVALSVTPSTSVFGRVVSGFGSEDVAEAFLGALLFGIPMAVEDGTIEAGRYVAANPQYLLLTMGATVAIVFGVLYVADIQDVRVSNPILGIVPRRPVGVIAASLLTAVALFTAWGRVAWSTGGLGANVEPVAVCLVATFPMSIGAVLGDILPGS